MPFHSIEKRYDENTTSPCSNHLRGDIKTYNFKFAWQQLYTCDLCNSKELVVKRFCSDIMEKLLTIGCSFWVSTELTFEWPFLKKASPSTMSILEQIPQRHTLPSHDFFRYTSFDRPKQTNNQLPYCTAVLIEKQEQQHFPFNIWAKTKRNCREKEHDQLGTEPGRTAIVTKAQCSYSVRHLIDTFFQL